MGRDPGCDDQERGDDAEAVVDVLSYVILGLAAVGLLTVLGWFLSLTLFAVRIALTSAGLLIRLIVGLIALAFTLVAALLSLMLHPVGIALLIVLAVILALRGQWPWLKHWRYHAHTFVDEWGSRKDPPDPGPGDPPSQP